MTYIIIFFLLLIAELVYFKVADHFNIIDKPNERSSHSSVVLRGGGVIFAFAAIVWAGMQMVDGGWLMIDDYLPFLIGLVIIATVSFVDDIVSLPDKVRLIAQFVAATLAFYNLGLFGQFQGSGSMISGILLPALMVLGAYIAYVGATNIINFMDGINGITGAYAMASLIPLYLLNTGLQVSGFRFQVSSFRFQEVSGGFVDQSLICTVMLADIVFCIFNFRPRGKAKCFAGDVGSISVAFILLFLIGSLVIKTGDLTWFIFLIVYGVDGCLTICHRIMLHEKLGEAHRKHAFQLMANELKMSHITVSLFYALLQLVISLGFIFICPDTVLCHWLYLLGTLIILSVGYVLFMKKYYHLHEEYLASLELKD